MMRKSLFNTFELFLLKTSKKFPFIISDKKFIELDYKCMIGKKLYLDNPKTFNEKLQWLKLNNHKDIYTKMVDKYEAKKYVSNIIGDEYIIPTLGIYNSFDEIDFNILPNQFVIKCTHDSGGLYICKDKNSFNKKDAKEYINSHFKKNYYNEHREWPYKNVKPRIIVEKYMEDDQSKNIVDYKFFCFDGSPNLLYVSDGSHTNNQRIAFFDKNYNQLDIKRTDYNDYEKVPNKPKNFEKMKEFASILSKNIPHLRVDFYEINGKLYFGELTFFTGSGFVPFKDEKWNKKLGDMIKLPIKNNIIMN